jgi:hypothetical protein
MAKAENEQESPVDEQEPVANADEGSTGDENPTDEQVNEAQADSDSDTKGLEDTRLTDANILEKSGFVNYSDVPAYEGGEADAKRRESQTTVSSIAKFKDEGDQPSTNGAPAAKVGKRTV